MDWIMASTLHVLIFMPEYTSISLITDCQIWFVAHKTLPRFALLSLNTRLYVTCISKISYMHIREVCSSSALIFMK
jgi:hypothetical protein